MHGTLPQVAGVSTEIRCTPLSDGARVCTAFVRAVRGMWPRKTAEELAARAGGGLRNAKYVLAGKREPTRAMIRAVMTELLAD